MNELKNDYQLLYTKPKKVYIPILDENTTILVRKNDYVFKDSALVKNRTLNIFIYSSVSGKVIGIDKCYVCNREIKCLVIENDYKERTKQGLCNLELNQNNFLFLLKKYGVVELDETNFPTYLKYNKKTNILVINCISDLEQIYLKENIEIILETIDNIIEINNIKKAIIFINNKELLNKVNDYIGTYLKIKVLYKNILTGKIYNNIVLKENNIITNTTTIYSIYLAIKLNRTLTEKIIIFKINNENIKLLVKIGTSIKEILDYLKLNCESVFINNKEISKEILEKLIIDTKIEEIKINGQNKNKKQNHILN